ncbi:MAG: hypothetical protein RJA34_1859 [Pseudomonadota bacterium]|jgi:hypothetical protein
MDIETNRLSNSAVQHANARAILEALGKTGWARAEDLHWWTDPWPFSENAAEVIRRLLKQLLLKGWVSAHKLPSRFGTAYRLTTDGLNLCRRSGIVVAWQGHPAPTIGPRFHEHLFMLNTLRMWGPDHDINQVEVFFARDLKWAPREEGSPFKRLTPHIQYSQPQKEVDGYVHALIEENDGRRLHRYYFEFEWGRKTGPKMHHQLESMEEVLSREPSASFVLVYPSDPHWQQATMRAMGSDAHLIHHRERLLGYMRQRPALIRNADRIYFLEHDVSGNFHFNMTLPHQWLIAERDRLRQAMQIVEEDWRESNVYLGSNGQVEHISYHHLPSGASFDMWRETSVTSPEYGWNWRWSTSQAASPSSAFGGDGNQEHRPFDKDCPRERWDKMAQKLKRSLLRRLHVNQVSDADAES